MIDPGHGGTDTGAVRANVVESKLVLNLAKQLKKMIDQDPQFRTHLTRETDKLLPLQDRVQLAENWGADIFISLHANTAPDARARGIEVFFQNSLPPDEEAQYLANLENQLLNQSDSENKVPSKSNDIALIIQDLHRQAKMRNSLSLSESLKENFDQKNKVSIKQAPFYVIAKAPMPSILVEVGFLTHPQELKKLQTPEYQLSLAKKIHSALVQYKEKIDSQEPQALK